MRRIYKQLSVVAIPALLLITFSRVEAQVSATTVPAERVRTDSAAVVHVIEQFHGALARGDSAAALALLAADALILETGGVETVAEYRSHHLPADIEFAKSVQDERRVVRVSVLGDAAWVSGTSAAKGQFRGRAVDSAGAELIVLVRGTSGWRISAIHWSSRRRG